MEAECICLEEKLESLDYSPLGLSSRDLFYVDNNFIIYVEDRNKEYEYENIFNRLFKDSLKIQPIGLNGKPSVKQHFKENGCFIDGKPVVYLVDADFDILLDDDIIENSNFIYLDRYNIESYYIDENVVLTLMSFKLKSVLADTQSIVNFNFWKEDTHTKFENLFINYVIAKKHGIDSLKIKPLSYTGNDGLVQEHKVNEYIAELQNNVEDYEMLREEIIQKYNELLGGDSNRLICGKYLIACLCKYLASKQNVSGSKVKLKFEDFKDSLIMNFNIDNLSFLKDKIEQLLY